MFWKDENKKKQRKKQKQTNDKDKARKRKKGLGEVTHLPKHAKPTKRTNQRGKG